VDSVVFALEVLLPVDVEVAVAMQGAELEDGFCAGESPAGAGDVQAVLDEVAACAFDRPEPTNILPLGSAGTLAGSAHQHCDTNQGCRDAHIHFLAAPALARYHATVASMPSRSGIPGSHPASCKTETSNSLRGVPSGFVGSQRVSPL
jgi:hypothetical protein